MTATVRGKASNRTARRMIPSSPITSVGGNDSASAYNFAMISGPIPHASPMVIASGICSRLGILFHFHKRLSHGSRAAEPASFCHQRQRLFTQESQDGYPCLHLAQDFEGLRSQSATQSIGGVTARGDDSADPALAHQSAACLGQPANNPLSYLCRRQIQCSPELLSRRNLVT